MVELVLPRNVRDEVFQNISRNVNRNLSFQHPKNPGNSARIGPEGSRRALSMHGARYSGAETSITTSCPNSPSVKKACRLIVLGSCRTGKTAILKRFLKNAFDECYTPTIEDFHRKIYKIRGVFYQIDILDTSGNDPFPATRRLSLLTGDMFLIVCSPDNEQSCDEAFRLRDQILELKAEMMNCSDQKTLKIPLVVALNKTDLPLSRQAALDKEHTRRLAAQCHNCGFFECSAKEDKGIAELFSTLFALAKLPKELSPITSAKVDEVTTDSNSPVRERSRQGSGFKLASKSSLVRLRSKRSEPVIDMTSVAESAARRPSLRTDLLLLKAKTSNSSLPLYKQERKRNKCVIL